MSAMDIISRQGAARKFGVSSLVGDITERVQRYKTYRRTLDELEQLSERELADLGMTRSMFRSIAYKAAYDG